MIGRERIEALFEEALDVPRGERDAWLAERCGGDRALRGEVEALLEAHDETGGLLDGSEAVAAAAASALLRDDDRGRQIGPYRVLRELGRGGMGVVYLAERNDGQFRRRVAVKLLRASSDADELHRRFLTERQILASLSHPNIAQLLDGGVADGRLPYLVIEYVDGLPITEYCDRNRLGVERRLRLFQEVCAAVHHAHQNLVLHRDLKPGNVLVTNAGQVKLLDFGIAKILNPSLMGVEQAVTRTAFRMMTPAYASPEQVRGDSLTTASDVYSLGLVLYELLTGHQSHRVTSDAPHAMVEAICEREPERPSARVTHGDREAALSESPGRGAAVTPGDVASARDTTPERLHRQLQGDLDAIVMMAVRKEPGRRYGSAELLAADIARHLDGLPVLAHRGSRGYRARKLLGRHRATALGGGLGVLALVAGASVALWQGRIAARERDRATAALAESERERRQSDEVSAFLVSLFEASDPSEGRADTLTTADLLRRGVARADGLRAEPLVQARMFDALGRAYLNLGDLSRSADLLTRAFALKRERLGDQDPETAATAAILAEVRRRRGEYAQAESLALAALRARRAVLGETHPDVAVSLRQLSGIVVYRGDLVMAEQYVREALAVQRSGASSPSDSRIAHALDALSAVLWRRGKLGESLQSIREALAIFDRAHPGPNANKATLRLRLADRLSEAGIDLDEADALYRLALAETRASLGDAHPRTAAAMKVVGVSLAKRGAFAEAEALLRESLERARRALGPANLEVASIKGELAIALAYSGRVREAEQLAGEALLVWERTLGARHSAYAGALTMVAEILVQRGALDSAETLFRRAIEIRSAVLEPQSALPAITSLGLADVLARRGRFAESDSLYRNALEIIRTQVSEHHPDVRRTYAGMARLHEAWGHSEEAVRFRERAGAILLGTSVTR